MTPQQRLELYQLALKGIGTGRHTFLCIALKSANNHLSYLPNPAEPMDHCPELLALKPQNRLGYSSWWNTLDATPRIKALEQAIKAAKLLITKP